MDLCAYARVARLYGRVHAHQVKEEVAEPRSGEGSYECPVCWESCRGSDRPVLACPVCPVVSRIHQDCALLKRCPQCQGALEEVAARRSTDPAEVMDVDDYGAARTGPLLPCGLWGGTVETGGAATNAEETEDRVHRIDETNADIVSEIDEDDFSDVEISLTPCILGTASNSIWERVRKFSYLRKQRIIRAPPSPPLCADCGGVLVLFDPEHVDPVLFHLPCTWP